MNKLVIYDVDDTIFFLNDGKVYIRDEAGNMVEEIDAKDFKEDDHPIDDACWFDFSFYTCGETFHNTATPNPTIIKRVIADLQDPEKTVYFVTARPEVTNLDMYIAHFHRHGLEITREHLHFCGPEIGSSDIAASWMLKLPVFEKLLRQNIWNHATIYDDNFKNLMIFKSACAELDIPNSAYHVSSTGEITKNCWVI